MKQLDSQPEALRIVAYEGPPARMALAGRLDAFSAGPVLYGEQCSTRRPGLRRALKP